MKTSHQLSKAVRVAQKTRLAVRLHTKTSSVNAKMCCQRWLVNSTLLQQRTSGDAPAMPDRLIVPKVAPSEDDQNQSEVKVGHSCSHHPSTCVALAHFAAQNAMECYVPCM